MFDGKEKLEDQEEFEPTNEDHLEDPDFEAIENNSQQKIKDLRDKLKACEKEKMQSLEEMQRAKADFLNSRRRLEEERAKDKDRQVESHIEDLLPLCDSFNSAMSDSAWQEVDKKWRAGVEGIFAQLQAVLNLYGTKAIDPKGQEFNPNLYDAVSTAPVENKEDADKVLQTVQLGYTREVNGETKLIRPARVIVGKFDK